MEEQILQLKAQAYDLVAMQEKVARDLQQINMQIAELYRVKEQSTPEKEDKPKK